MSAEPASPDRDADSDADPAAAGGFTGQRVPYGSDADQRADLYLPADPDAGTPVAVLVHGGFWQSRWTAALMDPMARDLLGRGWIVWNLEYRRPDRWSWEVTASDVRDGIAALAAALAAAGVPAPAGGVEVVGIGHSAGAQLIVRAAADQDRHAAVRVGVAVSLAGILDLAETERRNLGDGAVRRAVGGTPSEVPERYAAADPLQLLPLRLPQLVVQGLDDSPDLVEMSRSYADAAQRAGDLVRRVDLPGDHFAVIDPGSTIWAATMDTLGPLLPGTSVQPRGHD